MRSRSGPSLDDGARLEVKRNIAESSGRLGVGGVFALTFAKCARKSVSTKIMRSLQYQDTLQTGFLLGHPDITDTKPLLVLRLTSLSILMSTSN